MIHKAFILGAGLGTRLRPLTDTLPKPLVPIFHEPMANYAMRHCQAAGIRDFAINTHHLPDSWLQCYPDRTFKGSKLQFFHEPVLLETGGGIRNIASFIGDDPILVYNGDILTDIDISRLIKEHQASDNPATLALRSSGDNCNVNVEGKRITDMRNLLGNKPGTHQFTGIYCIEPEILSLIPDAQITSIVPAFIELIQRGQLGAVTLDQGHWYDIGNPEAYLKVHQDQTLSSNPAIHPDAIIHPDAKVNPLSCVIGPRTRVEAGAHLNHCVVWPDSVVPSRPVNHEIILPTATIRV